MLALWMKLRKTHTVVASPLIGEMASIGCQRGFKYALKSFAKAKALFARGVPKKL
jgi:hypothetical protein